jgi:hypothetical protein
MSRIVDDAEFARWIVESVATMDDTSSVTFFDTEGTIGSRQQTNKRVSNSVLNLQMRLPSIILHTLCRCRNRNGSCWVPVGRRWRIGRGHPSLPVVKQNKVCYS